MSKCKKVMLKHNEIVRLLELITYSNRFKLTPDKDLKIISKLTVAANTKAE